MVRQRTASLVRVVSILGNVSLVFAHDHGNHGAAGMEVSTSMTPSASPLASGISSAASTSVPPTMPTYFTHSGLSGFMLAHIGLMTVAWFFVLPISVVLSIARSRLALATQIGFFGLNAFGLLVGTIYDSKTPDLYDNNLHHKLGWAVTWISLAQIIVGLFSNRRVKGDADNEERISLMAGGTHCMNEYQQKHPHNIPSMHRYSHDSGHGTESVSSRSRSTSLTGMHEEKEEEAIQRLNNQTHDNDVRGLTAMASVNAHRILSHTTHMIPNQVMKILMCFYDMVDLSILIIGFILIMTGFITYAGIFQGTSVFNGLAHAVKGGIFFWYGLLTLGRWMGCFAEYGWAWNIRPVGTSGRKAKVPSAEFVESFVIFLYGSTNVFLEHLAAWGDAWTAQDLEHVSITVMFFGAGLCGMLVESRKIRDLLNASLARMDTRQDSYAFKEQWTPPRTYSFSMNPFPGLVILLLGLMMSSHHQHSMVSTMVHKQWGTLFVGFALARAVTYILMYLSPPLSHLPSRPPSELVAAFCLISGGLIFIASNKDTVAAMERHDLNAMFIFTVTMGWTAFVMAWQIIVLAIKGWAVKRRHLATRPPCGTLVA